eukprot:2293129-Amphidinium_carterae.2
MNHQSRYTQITISFFESKSSTKENSSFTEMSRFRFTDLRHCEALNYTAAECNYGGRVTDTHDRRTPEHRTINFILTDFYCEDILKDAYRFSSSGVYYAPQYQTLNGCDTRSQVAGRVHFS